MSLPVASSGRDTSKGAMRRGSPPGWPNTPPLVPRAAPVTGSGDRLSRGTCSRARSRLASKATTVALSRRPSLRSTVVERSPATTCALVTTRSSATTKPDPSCMRWQATPSTLTTDAATRAAVAGSMPLAAGGGPTSGVGWKASKTWGNLSSPTSTRRA